MLGLLQARFGRSLACPNTTIVHPIRHDWPSVVGAFPDQVHLIATLCAVLRRDQLTFQVQSGALRVAMTERPYLRLNILLPNKRVG